MGRARTIEEMTDRISDYAQRIRDLEEENYELKELVGALTEALVLHSNVNKSIGLKTKRTESLIEKAKHALQNGSVSDISNGVEYMEGE